MTNMKINGTQAIIIVMPTFLIEKFIPSKGKKKQKQNRNRYIYMMT